MTNAEYVAIRSYDHNVFLQHLGAPGWFMPAMAAALAPININLVNLNAKLSNAQANRNADALVGLQTAAGIVPAGFPATRDNMSLLTAVNATALLVAYGQVVPAGQAAAVTRNQLRLYCGVPQPDFN